MVPVYIRCFQCFDLICWFCLILGFLVDIIARRTTSLTLLSLMLLLPSRAVSDAHSRFIALHRTIKSYQPIAMAQVSSTSSLAFGALFGGKPSFCSSRLSGHSFCTIFHSLTHLWLDWDPSFELLRHLRPLLSLLVLFGFLAPPRPKSVCCCCRALLLMNPSMSRLNIQILVSTRWSKILAHCSLSVTLKRSPKVPIFNSKFYGYLPTCHVIFW